MSKPLLTWSHSLMCMVDNIPSVSPTMPTPLPIVERASKDSKKLLKAAKKEVKKISDNKKKKQAQDTYAFDINRFTSTKLTDYFNKLFRCLKHQTSSTHVSVDDINFVLEKSGFHFSESAIAVYYAVLDPVRPLPIKLHRPNQFCIEDCVKAMIYCCERQFFRWNNKYSNDGRTFPSYK